MCRQVRLISVYRILTITNFQRVRWQRSLTGSIGLPNHIVSVIMVWPGPDPFFRSANQDPVVPFVVLA